MKIQLTRNIGMLLLGTWLILWGLAGLGLSFPGLDSLLAIWAIVAGVMVLLGR